jgi:hypothetical protein
LIEASDREMHERGGEKGGDGDHEDRQSRKAAPFPHFMNRRFLDGWLSHDSPIIPGSACLSSR